MKKRETGREVEEKIGERVKKRKVSLKMRERKSILKKGKSE
jgi:hypothetical protein